jgi:acetyl-CoA carboxylase biotin carboxyl carrier protein
MALSYEDIAEIVRIIDSSSCDEVVIKTAELELVVRRHGAGSVAPTLSSATAAAAAAAVPFVAAADPQQRARSAGDDTERRADQVLVRAPMVGTFYGAPSPEAPPFVMPGGHVKTGDALCLIEVMKLFTTITAECDGRVVEIGAHNGALVEFGQLLFVIDPAARK